MYAKLFDAEPSRGTIGVVKRVVEQMPPAYRYSLHSYYKGEEMLEGAVQSPSVIAPEEFTPSMLGDDDFIGRVSWVFNEGTLLLQITEDGGISITSTFPLIHFGKNIVGLVDTDFRPTSLKDNLANPDTFRRHLVANEEAFLEKVLDLLWQRW